jgi:hypothetical protein
MGLQGGEMKLAANEHRPLHNIALKDDGVMNVIIEADGVWYSVMAIYSDDIPNIANVWLTDVVTAMNKTLKEMIRVNSNINVDFWKKIIALVAGGPPYAKDAVHAARIYRQVPYEDTWIPVRFVQRIQDEPEITENLSFEAMRQSMGKTAVMSEIPGLKRVHHRMHDNPAKDAVWTKSWPGFGFKTINVRDPQGRLYIGSTDRYNPVYRNTISYKNYTSTIYLFHPSNMSFYTHVNELEWWNMGLEWLSNGSIGYYGLQSTIDYDRKYYRGWDVGYAIGTDLAHIPPLSLIFTFNWVDSWDSVGYGWLCLTLGWFDTSTDDQSLVSYMVAPLFKVIVKDDSSVPPSLNALLTAFTNFGTDVNGFSCNERWGDLSLLNAKNIKEVIQHASSFITSLTDAATKVFVLRYGSPTGDLKAFGQWTVLDADKETALLQAVKRNILTEYDRYYNHKMRETQQPDGEKIGTMTELERAQIIKNSIYSALKSVLPDMDDTQFMYIMNERGEYMTAKMKRYAEAVCNEYFHSKNDSQMQFPFRVTAMPLSQSDLRKRADYMQWPHLPEDVVQEIPSYVLDERQQAIDSGIIDSLEEDIKFAFNKMLSFSEGDTMNDNWFTVYTALTDMLDDEVSVYDAKDYANPHPEGWYNKLKRVHKLDTYPAPRNPGDFDPEEFVWQHYYSNQWLANDVQVEAYQSWKDVKPGDLVVANPVLYDLDGFYYLGTDEYRVMYVIAKTPTRIRFIDMRNIADEDFLYTHIDNKDCYAKSPLNFNDFIDPESGDVNIDVDAVKRLYFIDALSADMYYNLKSLPKEYDIWKEYFADNDLDKIFDTPEFKRAANKFFREEVVHKGHGELWGQNWGAVAGTSPVRSCWMERSSAKMIQVLDHIDPSSTVAEDEPEIYGNIGFEAKAPMRVELWKLPLDENSNTTVYNGSVLNRQASCIGLVKISKTISPGGTVWETEWAEPPAPIVRERFERWLSRYTDDETTLRITPGCHDIR